MSFKIALIAIFVVLSFFNKLASSDCGGGPSHNFSYGQRTKGDELLFMDIAEYESHFFRIVTAELQYPLPGQPKEGYITYMEVKDQITDGTGGCVYVRNGGVGQSSVTFYLESQRGEAMKFVIRIYGLRRQI